MYCGHLRTNMGGQNINLEENSTLSSGFAYISEMIRYLISGTTAFLLYWPFGWIFLNFNYFQNNNIIAVFFNAYQQLLNVSISWSAAPLFLILPYFGLLNRAIIYTLVETMLIKFCFKDQATCNNMSSSSNKSNESSCIIHKPSIKLRECSCIIRERAIRCLSKQFDLRSYKTMKYLESCINPCWQLSGSFEFIDFQEWLLKDKVRIKVWDHMRLMYGIYGSFYLTFLTFVIMYILFSVLNLIFGFLNNQIYFVIFNYLIEPLIFLFILLY